MCAKQLHVWSNSSATCWIWISGLAFGISLPLTTNALHPNQWVSLYKVWNSCSWSESMRKLELKWPCICTSKPNSKVLTHEVFWLASTSDVFNRFMMGPNEEGRCFAKELTAAGIWFHGLWYGFDFTMVTMLLLRLILALTLSSPDVLPMYYFIQIQPYTLSPKGMKYFCHKNKEFLS